MKLSTKLLIGATAIVAIGAASLFIPDNGGTFPQVPTHGVPSPNAYDYDTRASASTDTALHALAAAYPKLTAGPIPDFSWMQDDDKMTVVQDVESDLQTVREGFSFPFVNPPLRKIGGSSQASAHFRTLGLLLGLEGDVKENEGDWGGASQSYLDAIKLGVDIPHGSSTLGLLAGMDCETTGQQGLWGALTHLSSPQAMADLVRLRSIEANRCPIASNFREDKYEQQANLIERYQSPFWYVKIAYSAYNGGIGGDTIQLMWKLKSIGKQKLFDEMSTYDDAVIRTVGMPYTSALIVPSVPVDPATLAQDQQIPDDPYTMGMKIYARYVDAESQNEMLITALALRAYGVEHNAYPHTLAQLVPGYLPRVPNDPFLPSAPLHYIQFDRNFTLYSVGPDGIDDHGAAINDNSSSSPGWVKRDSKGDDVAGVNL